LSLEPSSDDARIIYKDSTKQRRSSPSLINTGILSPRSKEREKKAKEKFKEDKNSNKEKENREKEKDFSKDPDRLRSSSSASVLPSFSPKPPSKYEKLSDKIPIKSVLRNYVSDEDSSDSHETGNTSKSGWPDEERQDEGATDDKREDKLTRKLSKSGLRSKIFSGKTGKKSQTNKSDSKLELKQVQNNSSLNLSNSNGNTNNNTSKIHKKAKSLDSKALKNISAENSSERQLKIKSHDY